MEAPRRTTKQGDWHCHCLLIRPDGRSYCMDNTRSPDRPFCDNCEDRHSHVIWGMATQVTEYRNREEAEAWLQAQEKRESSGVGLLTAESSTSKSSPPTIPTSDG